MEIKITGDPKEIAALVLAVQERREIQTIDLSKLNEQLRKLQSSNATI